MRTAGSIDVERKVKHLKHQRILSKTCNHLKDYKGVAYFRAKENLNQIMHAKKVLGKRIIDSLK
jgi:hypothetical protein